MKSKRPKKSGIEAEASTWLARRDAGLSPEEEQQFSNWRKADPRHEEAVVRYDKLWSMLDRPRKAGRADTMVLELQRRQRVVRARRTSLAATCVALMLVGLFVWRQSEPAPKVLAESIAKVTAVVIQPEKRLLPDGSSVELNSGAEIAIDFSKTERLVKLLKGDAHFSVAKNPQRPFVVRASGLDFRAVGTAFAVQLGEGQVDLIVTQGRVAVETGPVSAEAKESSAPTLDPRHTVDAGTLVHINLPSQVAPLSSTQQSLTEEDVGKRLAWRATRLEFTGTPLSEAVALVNRYNDIQFVIQDPTLSSIQVSGYLRANNTDAFIFLLEGSLGMQVERSGQVIRLSRRQ